MMQHSSLYACRMRGIRGQAKDSGTKEGWDDEGDQLKSIADIDLIT